MFFAHLLGIVIISSSSLHFYILIFISEITEPIRI